MGYLLIKIFFIPYGRKNGPLTDVSAWAPINDFASYIIPTLGSRMESTKIQHNCYLTWIQCISFKSSIKILTYHLYIHIQAIIQLTIFEYVEPNIQRNAWNWFSRSYTCTLKLTSKCESIPTNYPQKKKGKQIPKNKSKPNERNQNQSYQKVVNIEIEKDQFPSLHLMPQRLETKV